MKVTVERSGFLATVQDLGRLGHRESGVAASGALDPHALRVANLLVGNGPECAGLEATFGQLRLRIADERLIAWCGGGFEVQIGSSKIPPGRAALLHPGGELIISAPARGARMWLAISGGIDVSLVLGSRSTDLRSGFGGLEGRPLRDGDVFDLGAESGNARRVREQLGVNKIGDWFAPQEWASTTPAHPFLRILKGAKWSRFKEESSSAFIQETFTVMAESDRMGVRLEGPKLGRGAREDALSETVAPGTIQVPPSGDPILLLGDCQTIGGYPKIAHVITVDLAAAAQLVPGDSVRFAEISLAEAHQLLLERERELRRFRIGLTLRCL